MLSVMLRLLRASFPKVQTVVLSQNPHETAQIHQTSAINRLNLFHIWRALEHSTLFVLGGGSLLQDSTSQRSLMYYLGLIRWAKQKRRPIFLIGQGIGPLLRKSSRSSVASVLAEVDSILVRDRESYEELIALGVNHDQLICGRDLALLMERELHYSSCPNLPSENYFCAVLKDGLTQAQIFNFAKNFDTIHKKLGLLTVLVPFFQKRDWPTLQTLAQQMNSPVQLVNSVNFASNGVWSLIANSQFVIGMRLHSLVFSLNAHVPFIAINYDQKIERFIHRVEAISGVQLPLWDTNGLDKLCLLGQINQLWTERESVKSRLKIAQEELSKEAKCGWDQLSSQMEPYLEETK